MSGTVTDRKHLPKLTNDQLGVNGIVGWYLEPSTRDEGKEWVIFQCPNNHRGSLRLHSIEPNGEVNASILCHGGTKCVPLYHEMCILDDWDSKTRKNAKELYPVNI